MIVFDIDDTISPTRPPKDWSVEHETERIGFVLRIPTYILDFLRSRDDIALLSTWGNNAARVAAAFNFKAAVFVMSDEQYGIEGKYEIISSRTDITAWVDDHIKPSMEKSLNARGVVTIRPTGGQVSEREIRRLASL